MQADSYLTAEELAAVNESINGLSAPFLIQCVSKTQLSIARYGGGINFRGQGYTYCPPTDELIRNDVLKFITKRRKAEAKAAKTKAAQAAPAQKELT